MEKKGCMSDVTRNLGKTLGIRERTSQMGLFTPKWMSNDLAKALRAVEKITDSQKLAEVAVNAKLQQVAGKAIERIQDESVLAGIALGDAGFFAVEKSLERVFHPDLLKQIADEAEMNWVRVAALSRLTKQNRNFDLLPYRDLIQVCVKAGNIDAVSLCTDRIILEDVYRLNRQQWLKDKKQWNVMRSFEERINQLASECIRDTQLPSGLKRFIAPGNLYSDEVRNAARAKLNAMILPENSSQEELYKAALNNPDVREKALSRLSDPELLAKIARNAQFSPQTRVQMAEKAGIGNPFGRRTLVCPNCGNPAIYREMYESIDSWQIEADFRCREYKQGCAWCSANNPLGSFSVGDADINWKGKLIFICPSCGKRIGESDASASLKQCDCGSREAPVPVEYQFG